MHSLVGPSIFEFIIKLLNHQLFRLLGPISNAHVKGRGSTGPRNQEARIINSNAGCVPKDLEGSKARSQAPLANTKRLPRQAAFAFRLPRSGSSGDARQKPTSFDVRF